MGEITGIEILVVEDEEAICRGLCDVLAYHGHAPTGAASGEDGARLGLDPRFSLVILDVMLPGRSGFDVCEELRRARPRLPILVLTARGAEEDVLRGFRAGADDYVTKPFSVAEVVARVEALLRRSRRAVRDEASSFRVGSWRVDPGSLVAEREGERVTLSRLEMDLLALLDRERGRIVSRRVLLQEVWGYEAPERIETRTVDVHVATLRKRLGDEGRKRIETVRGEGYRLAT
ncbi:Alkaline phosphatase synthesis transcriptional regulatory protein PhoP [Myxococcaceae bacterium]|jgi:two-component system response regulator RegX3|nr:Alkaline phosphatase synthesis transcriptional regulatory protein PhoP [Myxococcaceae bacterium]